ncbi:Ldh family oxidoreductase [Neorhizobium alkalisoli]|uniref:Ldh family oxidoreductase n=1 Tax=Neorhizobium alkalisoli TaxID=528178 RepID=UPI000CF9C440|nr:Ldh family oxidoreductase [Neorhizobium alkalisoli]
MAGEVTLEVREAEDLATRACRGAGASEATARSLVAATISAALFGPPTLGFPHLVDYLNSFREGRISTNPEPTLNRPYTAYFVSDADRGIAQLGFDRAFDQLVETVRHFGIAIFTQTNSYSAGELGYFVRRLAEKGIVGLAATNANAMVVSKPGGPAVYSTNPMAFGFPMGEGALPVIIDQASSATAFVNIVAAAEEGRSIPTGWAVDSDGNDTEDPKLAMNGALLAFGGRKGANVALLVEMMSAGISGGNWSLDTPDFRSGSASPGVGLTVIAIMPGADQTARIARAKKQADRLANLGVFIPGVTGTSRHERVSIPFEVHQRVAEFAASA